MIFFVCCDLGVIMMLMFFVMVFFQVSYVKGMDWYLMVCFIVIFLSLLECIIVDRLWRVNFKKVEDEKKNGNMSKMKRKVSKGENNYYFKCN